MKVDFRVNMPLNLFCHICNVANYGPTDKWEVYQDHFHASIDKSSLKDYTSFISTLEGRWLRVLGETENLGEIKRLVLGQFSHQLHLFEEVLWSVWGDYEEIWREKKKELMEYVRWAGKTWKEKERQIIEKMAEISRIDWKIETAKCYPIHSYGEHNACAHHPDTILIGVPREKEWLYAYVAGELSHLLLGDELQEFISKYYSVERGYTHRLIHLVASEALKMAGVDIPKCRPEPSNVIERKLMREIEEKKKIVRPFFEDYLSGKSGAENIRDLADKILSNIARERP